MHDERRVQRVIHFIRLLRHTRGRWAGVPFNLADWQIRDLIRPLFGTITPEGVRQYRTCFMTIARKNGKSELASALALYMLFADGEIGAEIYSAAADREQAAIVFRTAVAMRDQSPALRARSRVTQSRNDLRIVVPATNSFWRVLSADAPAKHGLNPHAVIFDELHAQPNRELWDVLSTGFGARQQPLMLAITTAGYDRHSVCYEQYDYAKRILAGEIQDPTFLPVIYEVPPDVDWRDETFWPLANPGLGDFRSWDEMRAMAARAHQVPALQNTFRRLYLNQWTEQAERWLDMAAWDASAGDVNARELEGQVCYGGLDLSSTTDLSALVLLFPREDGTIKMLAHFWIPREGMRERVNRDRVPYDVWEREGYLTATAGSVIDYEAIRQRINELGKIYRIEEIAFDRWGAIQLVQQLEGDGFTMVAMGQGFASMSSPTKEFQAAILGRRLHHGGNPVLRWMASNVSVKQDPAGNLKPDKSRSNGRIDGIVAAIMALDRIVRRERDSESVYEERGIVTI